MRDDQICFAWYRKRVFSIIIPDGSSSSRFAKFEPSFIGLPDYGWDRAEGMSRNAQHYTLILPKEWS